MMGRTLATVAIALVLVTAGCTTLFPVGAREDPEHDRLGYEDGYWYDSSVDVTTADGLNESEREAVVARTMARVERIRGLEFEEQVPVEVISREQYRQRNTGGGGESVRSAWNEQVWEALFLVGENRSVSSVFGEIYGSSVQGYYSPSRDEIVIVSSSETPTIDRTTLAHELVHALQDQHFDFGPPANTQDQQLANDGLVEGDANYVQREYEARCTGAWSCIERPDRGGSGSSADFDMGVFLAIYAPYAEGPGFVDALHERGGWDAVNDAYAQFPESTEQVIHPAAYPDERPANLTVRDRSSGGWDRFPVEPTYDVAGEASIYAMLWATERIDREGGEIYDYAHPLSAGWNGDRVVPYRDDGEAGYVWKLRWDTTGDARAFVEAYRGILDDRGAREVDDGVYVVDDGAFADAFRVTRRGDTVVIVNGPTRGSLDRIHG